MRAAGLARLEAALTRAWQVRGAGARLLWPLALCHAALVALRRAAYRAGCLRSERIDRPVIVVGNRIAGGAGKTPCTIALLAHLQARGWRPGVVSRGHGRCGHAVVEVGRASKASAVGDEPLLIHLRTGAPVAVGRDRVAAARALIAAHPEVDVVLADDGLQHLRLARDIELLVFDARGAGNGWLLPAGPLREPLGAPSGARHAFVLYNADLPSTPLPGFMAHRSLGGVVGLRDWWQGKAAGHEALQSLRGADVLACCGIAQPERFFAALRAAGLAVRTLALPDHASFATLPWAAGVRNVVVTEKDAVKLAPERIDLERPATAVWVAPLDFEPEAALWAELDAALAALPAAPRREGGSWTPD